MRDRKKKEVIPVVFPVQFRLINFNQRPRNLAGNFKVVYGHIIDHRDMDGKTVILSKTQKKPGNDLKPCVSHIGRDSTSMPQYKRALPIDS